jgi:ABC-type transport system involved in Fe-S cluster assembly fused permease/ATPase subunit
VGGTHAPARAEGDIELRCRGLRYRDDAEPALDGLTCTSAAGETVALVGPSGAGKSTLVNLLPRFIEPTSGATALDGRPLRDWDMRALRRQFALVSQDVVLFNDSRGRQRGAGRRWSTKPACARAARGQPAGLRGRAAAGPAHRWWATTAASCRAASASAWPSPARCTRTRRS